MADAGVSTARTRAEQRAEDAAVMVAVAEGDRDALASLYDRYASLMFALGLRILISREETQDVLHDVFVEAWRKAGAYDPKRGSVRSWLVLRMRSRCLDRKRTAYSRRMQSFAEGDADRREGSSVDPSVAADRSALVACMQELPDEQREVLYLAYYEGLTTSEIASRVGVPLGTVKSRMLSARAKLRIALTAGQAESAGLA